MKHVEQVSPPQGVHRSQGLRRFAAITAGREIPFGLTGRDWLAFNTLLYLGILLIQFGLGMWINLFISIPKTTLGPTRPISLWASSRAWCGGFRTGGSCLSSISCLV